MPDTPISHLNVIIKKPQRIEYNGTAKAVTSINSKGKFDILPYHENFISLIKDSVTIHLDDNKTQTFELKSGVIKVTQNSVNILIGIEL